MEVPTNRPRSPRVATGLLCNPQTRSTAHGTGGRRPTARDRRALLTSDGTDACFQLLYVCTAPIFSLCNKVKEKRPRRPGAGPLSGDKERTLVKACNLEWPQVNGAKGTSPQSAKAWLGALQGAVGVQRLSPVPLSHHRSRASIRPHSLESRVAQVPISGPFGETDAAHEDRFEPHRRLPLGGGQAVAPGAALALGEVDEGAGRLPQRLAPCDELPDLAVGEAGADLGRITEPSLLVIADNQRPELTPVAPPRV
jgi:hypothetical protein